MQSGLIDSQGRHVSYLRVSVTDRCDMRCLYCMAEEMEFLPRDDVLTFAELDRICTVFIRRGVRRIRLTGGEPLVRRGIDGFVRELGRWTTGNAPLKLDELTLTTNGTQLPVHASALKEAGVRRVNVSMDSLDPARFASITRRGTLERTIAGIHAARETGLEVRVNTVVMRGVNDDELDRLIAWCGEVGTDLCLIETMPMGETGDDRTGHYLPLGEVRRDLAQKWHLVPLTDRSAGPARYMRVEETGRRLGFITPLSHDFCATCNRVRVSCTGQLYTCLGSDGAVDLRRILREGGTDDDLLTAINLALAFKPARHDFFIPQEGQDVRGPARLMNVTGG
ncbi:GTP 3',8-cyclase MoaA [Acetobacter estunensis]|uniref:GTP 3',8-cyclase MoaA n=1 Tax=Acetobacter estunensis TaxID=104097 RepID=UPI001C2CE486|nr:GTP 3',8-cyclase MoaA [Acetobacter estunensis]MBV1836396.1 GTP 3',8-cyclase MoaA [Acetobacter estunensis]